MYSLWLLFCIIINFLSWFRAQSQTAYAVVACRASGVAGWPWDEMLASNITCTCSRDMENVNFLGFFFFFEGAMTLVATSLVRARGTGRV